MAGLKIEWQRCFKIPKDKLDLFLVKLKMSDTTASYFEAAYIFEAGDVYDVVVEEFKSNYAYTEREIEEFVAKLNGGGPVKASSLNKLEEALWELREAFEHDIKSIEISKRQYKRLEWYCADKIKERSLAEKYPQHIEFFGIRIKEAE